MTTRALTVLGAAGLGALGAYFLDPISGRRRRHLVQDKLRHWSKTSQQFARKSARDVAHRTKGLAAEARQRMRREDVSDELLVDRVRSEMGRAVSHPSAIEVSARNGVVTLWGDVLRDEAGDLIRCVRKVRGVHEVEDQLMRHTTPGNVPGLQGGRGRPARSIQQEAWAPRLRLGAGALGVTGATIGVVTGGFAGAALIGTGLILFLRATTDLPIKRLVGIGAKRRAIDVLKHVHVNRPVEEVFAFFENFENFPRFMAHLKSVSVSDGRSHWVLDGPAHLPLSWDAETVRVEPNRSIAWRSVPGSTIRHGGVVRFEEIGPDLTRVEVRLSYNPPGGAVGHAVAKILGSDPKKLLDDDLIRLKSLLEEGRATGRERQVSREDLSITPPWPRE